MLISYTPSTLCYELLGIGVLAMKIAYLTGNAEKFEEAQHILEGWDLERVAVDLHEIQGDAETIACFKARDALKIVQEPLIVEDVSFSCPALGGLPGPYIKDFLRKLGEQGLYELVANYEDQRAVVKCVVAYIEPGGEPALFEGHLDGTVVAPRGSMRHGTYSWNSIFQPKGLNKTMGEMTMQEHASVSHRRIALEKLKAYLDTRSLKKL